MDVGTRVLRVISPPEIRARDDGRPRALRAALKAGELKVGGSVTGTRSSRCQDKGIFVMGARGVCGCACVFVGSER